MKTITLELDDELVNKMQEYATKQNISVEQWLVCCVEEHLCDAFGLWSEKGTGGGLEYQEQLRGEWDKR